MTYTIYKILNKVSGKVYVGSTNREVSIRWREHCYPSNNKLLGKDIRKLGKENFEFTILETVTCDKISLREKFWINHFNCLSPKGYNVWYGYFPFN